MRRAGSRDEMVGVLIVGLGGVGRWTDQTVGLSKVIILVQDKSRVALIGGENGDVGIGTERAKCRFFRFGEVSLLWEDGWKFGIRDVG